MSTPPSASNHVGEYQTGIAEPSPAVTSSPVLAYIDTSRLTRRLVPHAMAMARALNAPLTLLHVLDLPARSDGPADPVDWSIRRQEAYGRARRMATEARRPDLPKPRIRIAEGRPVDQICRSARELEACMTVVGTKAGEFAADWELGETARKLIDRCFGALLLVPPADDTASDVQYRRILVPLDGSRMAESILPLATRIARATGAELLLAHVIPAPELTEIGPLETDDHELRRQVSERNERVARKYVDQIRTRLACLGLSVRTVVVRDADVRSSLSKLVEDEQVDLMVLSAHGHSNRPDVPCGSVAAYLMTHARRPLLVVPAAHPHRAAQLGNDLGTGPLVRGSLS